jgi:hypothetical protein
MQCSFFASCPKHSFGLLRDIGIYKPPRRIRHNSNLVSYRSKCSLSLVLFLSCASSSLVSAPSLTLALVPTLETVRIISLSISSSLTHTGWPLTCTTVFYFTPGLGACGSTNTGSQHVASVSTQFFHSFPCVRLLMQPGCWLTRAGPQWSRF